ncbi:zinc finger, CCHC-type containing protein [Tanacetum coccineum]
MFVQHQGEFLSEAWTRFKDLLQKVSHHGLDLWLRVQIFYDHVDYTTQCHLTMHKQELRKIKGQRLRETIENGVENRIKNEPIKRDEKGEGVEAPSSQPVEYYLKHMINEKLIEGLVDNQRFSDFLLGVRVGKMKGNTHTLSPKGPVYKAILKKKITRKEDIGGNFKIPYNIGGLKCINALVDQGSDYIYPLGISEDELVDVASFVYPVDFVILDINRDEKRPFILGTPFMTTAKAVIKFDKGIVTLRFGKSKISFHRIPETLYKAEKGIKNNIRPIAPTIIVNRLVLEWEERIKLHLEKKMKFDQRRNKNFTNKRPALVKIENGMDDEGEVT